MKETKVQNKCPYCGYPIETKQHAPDCPGIQEEANDDIKEQTIGEAIEEKEEIKEQPSEISPEKSEEDIFIEQMDKETRLFQDTVEKLRDLSTPTSVPEKEEPTTPESEETQLTAAELKTQYDTLIKNYEELKSTSPTDVEQAKKIIEEIKKLEIKNTQDVQKMVSLFDSSMPILKTVKERLTNIKNILKEGKVLKEKYRSTSLKEEGFDSFDELSTAREKKHYEINNLHNKFLGRLRFRKKIDQLEVQRDSLDRLYNFQYDHNFDDSKWEIEHLDWEYKNLRDDLNSIIVNKIKERYDNLIKEIFPKEIKSEEILDEQSIDQLNNEFIEKNIIPKIIKDKDYNEKFFDKDIEIAILNIKRSFALGMGKGWGGDTEETHKIKEVRDEIDKLPPSLKYCIQYDIGRKHEPADFSFQKMAEFVKYKLPLHQKMEAVSSSHKAIFKNKSLRDPMELILEKNEFEKFILDFDTERWEVFRNNEDIKKLLENNNIEKADRYFEQAITERLLAEEEKSDNGYKFGRKLLSFKTPETIPLVILNSYHDLGHNGNYPFLNNWDEPCENSMLFKYIDSLSQKQINELKSVPGLLEIINIVKNNPKKSINPNTRENPIYKTIEQPLLQASLHYLEKGDIKMQFYIIDLFKRLEGDLPEKIISSPEIKEVAKQSFINHLNKGDFHYAGKINKKFTLLTETIEEEIKNNLMLCLHKDDYYRVFEIMKYFSLPKEFIQSKEVHEIVKKKMIENINNYNIDNALKIKSAFSLPEEFIQSKEVQEAAKQGIIKCLSDSRLDLALKIKERFDLPENFVQKAATEAIYKILDRGNNLENVIKLKNELSLKITNEQIIDNFPDMNDFLVKLQAISPDFYNQVYKSPDILIALFAFRKDQEQFIRIVKENSFLLEAVGNNTRFGSKLLTKYPEFDQTTKENIKLLFNTKKEILQNNSAIELDSLEFRQDMQNKLAAYKNNPEITEAIKETGIDLDAWLNYDETKYFSLESGKSKVAFSETIKTPIDRIKETISSYGQQIKNVLKEYQSELSSHQTLLENQKEIEEKIIKMREEAEKARGLGDERKVRGIQKGIESLQKKLENPRKAPLWDKLTGDIEAWERLKNDVYKAHEKLIKAENDFAEYDQKTSTKSIADIKQQLGQAKEELISKFGLLEKRIEDFRENLLSFLAPALGEDRAKALIQEIQQSLQEHFDHYNTDRSTLANLFSEKADKDREKLESKPMSIFVTTRNPDIDLYHGNYSPCCICIESTHLGAESTIADYNTDLGIQIVNIWDEDKNEPVTAAWCWLGEDEQGNAVLVVDNIESNTLYSSNFSEQLTKELFDYLIEYAKSIGVKKVVIGKTNNDLPTGIELDKMPDHSSIFQKIGGHNRAEGYYLEAENNPVKVIWSKE